MTKTFMTVQQHQGQDSKPAETPKPAEPVEQEKTENKHKTF